MVPVQQNPTLPSAKAETVPTQQNPTLFIAKAENAPYHTLTHMDLIALTGEL